MALKARQMTKLGNSRPRENIGTQSQSTTKLSNSGLRNNDTQGQTNDKTKQLKA